jgi:signal transduction histidine kinase
MLRRRVALASAGLGLAVCGLLVAAVLVITEDYETVLARELLRGQVDDYVLRVDNGLPAALPRTQRLAGYRDDAPAWLARLPPGLYEDLQYDGQHAGVFDTRAGRLRVVIDLSDIERLELHLHAWLAGFVSLGVALSALLGWWLAGTALRPLRHLASAVEGLRGTPTRTRLATHAPDDELGRLARAIDEYQARLAEADEHEQAFFADASHELRTPIAVVRGVAEVLLDDPALAATEGARLGRLDRGVRELGDLTEALLAVARRRDVRYVFCDLAAMVTEAARDVSPAAPIHVIVPEATAPLSAGAELPLLLRLVLRQLSRRDVAVTATVMRDSIRIGWASSTAPESDEYPHPPISPIVSRLAERNGWAVSATPGQIVVAPRHGGEEC